MPKKSRRDPPLDRVDFPYMKDGHGRYAPLVYFQAWTGHHWLYLQAYVDSGASWSVMHLDVAQLLGIPLSRTSKRFIELGDGNVLPVYLAKIRVRFAGQEFLVPAGFSEALRTGFNMMGRAGFFDRFLMTFNDRSRVLTAARFSARR